MGPWYFTYVVGVLLNYSYTGKMGSFDAKKLNKVEGDDGTKGMVHDQAKKGEIFWSKEWIRKVLPG